MTDPETAQGKGHHDYRTFWWSEVEECPECGSPKVFTDGDTRWCGPCEWSEEVSA